jgi:hypothetical protein
MTIPEPVTWTLTALMTGWEYREQISGVYGKTKELLHLNKLRIAMMGLSGSGKSTLIDDFEGLTGRVGYAPPGPSLDTDTGSSKNHLKRRAKFLAVPGANAAFRTASVNEVFEKPVVGIIHVVANGYSTIRESVTQQLLISRGVDSPEKLRELQLSEEAREFGEVANIIRGHYAEHKHRIFLSIVVNKYDLFSMSAEPVRAHYHMSGSSPFAEHVRQLQAAIGSDNIQITLDPVCAWPDDFVWNGHTVKTTLSRADRDRLTLRYLTKLNDLILATGQE